MCKKGGLLRGRAGPPLPQITRVKFGWLVFAACPLSEGLASQANMMVSVKLTIILPKNYKLLATEKLKLKKKTLPLKSSGSYVK